MDVWNSIKKIINTQTEDEREMEKHPDRFEVCPNCKGLGFEDMFVNCGTCKHTGYVRVS